MQTNYDDYILLSVDLRLFDGKTNVTGDSGMTPEMKTFYDKALIQLAEPELVHDQFGQKKPIPKNNGKTIEFRKFDSLPKATTPLTEGVTPDGQKLNVTSFTAKVEQYGGYVETSDMVELTTIDNVVVEATKLLASQAGRTLDTITRDILAGGTSVQYYDGSVESREELSYTDKDNNNNLTVDCIRRAARFLKNMNAPKINGDYVAIIHPDCAYDLMSDPEWKYPHQYQDTGNIYNGEIGKIAGVRFVETTEAKIFEKAGASQRDVYATLVLGDNAYGVTELTGGGLQHIVKPLGSSGSADPLNQRATVGWKATKTAERLVEQYCVRIETTSSFTQAAD